MADARWRGGAPARKQRTTITIANTWATSDTVSVTIAGKTLTVTVGSAFATTDVAAALNAAINAADATTGLIGTESRNFGGQEIPEFADVTAEVSGSVVSVYSAVAGTPFTMTSSESTAGTGTATAATPTAATGPNHADNAANYEAGTLPADNDRMLFDQGDVDCLYGLDYFRTNTIGLTIIITNDWTGQLGLPAVNAGGYAEYRQRYYYAYGSKTTTLNPGLKGSTDNGSLYLDYQGCQPTININVARNLTLSEPSVFIAGSGGATSTMTIKAGNVSVEPDDSGTGANVYEVSGLYVGVPGGNNSDLIVTLGSRTTWHATPTLVVHSGQLTIYDGFAMASPAQLNGGVTRLIGGSDVATFPAFDIRNGATLFPIYGAECGVIEVFSGGTLDCRETRFFFATSNGATAYPGARVYDPAGVFLFCAATALLELPGGRLNDITHELPSNRVVDMTASA